WLGFDRPGAHRQHSGGRHETPRRGRPDRRVPERHHPPRLVDEHQRPDLDDRAVRLRLQRDRRWCQLRVVGSASMIEKVDEQGRWESEDGNCWLLVEPSTAATAAAEGRAAAEPAEEEVTPAQLHPITVAARIVI